MEALSFFKQDLFENFIFAKVDYQKFDKHVQEMVDDIIKNNNLPPTVPLSELFFTNEHVSIVIYYIFIINE